VLIDFSPRQIELALPFNSKVYYGDGRRIDVLRAAGAGTARLIVFCMDDKGFDGTGIEAVRAAFPDVQVMSRAFDRIHWMTLRRAGVETVVRELFDSAIHMGQEALRALGDTDETIDQVTEEYRRRDNERLSLQLSTGDLLAGRELRMREPYPLADALGEIPFESEEDQ
jgi:voltage-gated potassium channel Kch